MALQDIQRFVVLMLENRSFDHLLGYLKTVNPDIEGLTGGEFSNSPAPSNPQSPPVPVSPNASTTMPYDPNHEFCDVQTQLYGPGPNPASSDPLAACSALPPKNPAAMSGFLASGIAAAKSQNGIGTGSEVMQCFAYQQVPFITSLAQQFALFNFWYSSLPGPTWPNRFFVHAATSGGLTDSPATDQIVQGFSFQGGTIYETLAAAGKDWRIYHDGLPQSAGIDTLRQAYVDPFTTHFREMQYFAQDVQTGTLAEYTFIEPKYDSGEDYENGNSMHPLNDISKGDLLVKQVYEALRASPLWPQTMLIVTFDEHGGFYDHVPPPPAVPPGDPPTYQNKNHPFNFDLYGVRVPGIVVSAYTQKGTVIGTDAGDPLTRFDHGSILATVEKRFLLRPMTNRDLQANTLECALNLDQPRSDAPATLPSPP
ncbi:MAG TPA: alkaline phosphatase family protein [Verrucomicrobiae bacterium]|jgi:phospholipase C|nr:alkaline phosphatase family protein [Verrucomicrobiae bacterium]